LIKRRPESRTSNRSPMTRLPRMLIIGALSLPHTNARQRSHIITTNTRLGEAHRYQLWRISRPLLSLTKDKNTIETLARELLYAACIHWQVLETHYHMQSKSCCPHTQGALPTSSLPASHSEYQRYLNSRINADTHKNGITPCYLYSISPHESCMQRVFPMRLILKHEFHRASTLPNHTQRREKTTQTQ
jgi:hypothetical protein